jgi:phage head maturation protease
MRDFVRSLDVTDVSTVGRTVEGVALSWDRAYRVSDDNGRSYYLEGWRAGAFTQGLRDTGNVFELRFDHVDQRAGRVAFSENARTLDFTATVDDGPIGDAVLAHVDAGEIERVSLRYLSDRQSTRDGIVWRLRARPRELSLVVGTKAQYDDAVITARRAIEVDPADLVAAAGRAERTAALLARSAEIVARGATLL